MRCPKCGYISFDHMESCRKCKKDISEIGAIEGTTYNAVPPLFLRVPEKVAPEMLEEGVQSLGGREDVMEEGSDLVALEEGSDLVALEDGATFTGNEGHGEGQGLMSTTPSSVEDEFLLEPEAEGPETDDEEVSFEFEFEEDIEIVSSEEASSGTLEVPDALADISDLAPPESGDDSVVNLSSTLSLSLDDEESVTPDLDLDGLDLDLGLRSASNVNDPDLTLSLDDIDLSEGDIVELESDLDGLSLDLDLDLDLNLESDGTAESPETDKEKPSGSLDGISLSLD